MGLMETIISASGNARMSGAFGLGGERRGEPGLSFAWSRQNHAASNTPEESAAFLVAVQTGVSSRGEPVFGRPFRSEDEGLALSEDGYLINSEGQFVLGLPLDPSGERVTSQPQVLRLDADSMAAAGTDCIVYRANLPSFPLTANADFEASESELLDKTQFARDPSAQGSGIVLGDDRIKFLARSLAGGSIPVFARDGVRTHLVLRWAKLGSLRSAGQEWWNLFYRVRSDPRGGEVAWKNCGHAFFFEADGRLNMTAQAIPIFDVMVEGLRLGNLSFAFGAGGLTQYADRAGLVKVLESRANGCAGGAFAGISMSTEGRLFAHYEDGGVRPIADVRVADGDDAEEDIVEEIEEEHADRPMQAVA